MPGYLVDEGGERTHAVLPLEEYERLTKAAEKLESVRGYAREMISAMGEEETAGGDDQSSVSPVSESDSDNSGAASEGGDHESRAWYQRT